MHPLRILRRDAIRDSFCGFGAMALASMSAEPGLADIDSLTRPKSTHVPAKAKSVIFLFMAGGPSHLETFDPKPLLNELNGQARPSQFGDAKYQFVQKDAKLLGSKRHSQSMVKAASKYPICFRMLRKSSTTLR